VPRLWINIRHASRCSRHPRINGRHAPRSSRHPAVDSAALPCVWVVIHDAEPRHQALTISPGGLTERRVERALGAREQPNRPVRPSRSVARRGAA
jgi:hypothetical protein